MTKTVYDSAFYNDIEMGSIASARVIMPLVLELVSPRSVADVGCGRGAWLKVCQELGIDDTIGVDGDYVDKSTLLIEESHFTVADLGRRFELGRRADLALCLEVAEHLPLSSASNLVKMLSEIAPYVLFAAAVPGQGGTHHVNEQWPDFWRRLFAGVNYVQLDPIRRHVFQDHRVAWWYQQNIYLYVDEAVVAQSIAMQDELARTQSSNMQAISSDVLDQYTSFRGLAKQTVRVGYRALRSRLARMGM